VLEFCASELAAKLGRSVEQILARGLNAGDFVSNTSVHLEFVDDSSAEFRYAFFVESSERDLVAVFTEHCGYFVFVRGGLTKFMEQTA
jgi:hypothetical protein